MCDTLVRWWGESGGHWESTLHFLSHCADTNSSSLQLAGRGADVAVLVGMRVSEQLLDWLKITGGVAAASPSLREAGCSARDDASLESGSASCGVPEAEWGPATEATWYRLDSLRRSLAQPRHQTRGKGPGGRTQMPNGCSSRRLTAPPPTPLDGMVPSSELTAAGPVGLLPAAGPVPARGWREEASRLFQDAGPGPAPGRAGGERGGPRGSPPGWRKGY